MNDNMHLDNNRRAELIATVLNPLREILLKYYLVNGKNFFDLDEHNVYKHQVLHLTKLVNKLVSYNFSSEEVEAKNIIKNEVAPDLLIYAQEIYLKSAVECWRPANELFNQATCLSTLLFHLHPLPSGNALSLVSKAAAVLADYCDRRDHRQAAPHDLSRDVAIPMTDAASILITELNVDPDVLYQKRLDDMIKKYSNWSRAIT